jgi:non-ribosomal peptide synthetase component F
VTFDLSVFDLFATTRAGACLVPIHESTMNAPVTFCRAVAKAGATVVYCVPSLILREAKGQALGWTELQQSPLRHIVFAGEPIDKPALRRLRPLLPDVPIHNWFGPTETNVCAFHHVTEADLAEDGRSRSESPALCQFRLRLDTAAAKAHAPASCSSPGTRCSAYWNRPETRRPYRRAGWRPLLPHRRLCLPGMPAANSSSSAAATAR